MKNNQQRETGGVSRSGGVGSSQRSPKQRRHRLRYVLVGVLLVLLLLVFLFPYWASTGPGSSLVLSAVNTRMADQVTAEDLSLSWFGPCRVKGLAVRDKQDREVLRVEQGTWSEGLWQGLSGPARMGSVTLNEPRAVIYPSVAEGQKSESKPEGYALPASVQQLRGTLRVSAGAVKIVSQGGEAYAIGQLDGNLEFDTLNKVKGDFKAQLADEGAVVAQMEAVDLLKEGRFDVIGAQGQGQLDIKKLDVGELAAMVPGAERATGSVSVHASVQMNHGVLTAEYEGGAEQLAIGKADARRVRPTDVALRGRVKADKKHVEGSAIVTGAPGQLEATYRYSLGEPFELPSPQALTAMALEGAKLEKVAAFDVEAHGQVDLAKLASAVPGLLKLQEEVEVTGGSLALKQFSLRGGATPAATVNFELSNLTARRQDKQLRYEPIVGDFAMEVKPEVGLEVERGRLAAAFAQVQVSGSADQLESQFSADLSLLQQQVSELVELGEFQMAGQVEGQVTLKRAQDEQVGVQLLVTGKDIKYITAERAFEANPLRVEGELVVPSSENDKVTVPSVRAQVGEQMTATGSGWYAVGERRGGGQVRVEADLDRARGNVRALLGGHIPARMSGQMLWQAHYDLSPAGMSLSGGGHVDNLRLGGGSKAFTERQVHIKHELGLKRDEKKLEVKNASIRSEALSAEVHGSVADYRQRAVMDVRGQYEADWEKLTLLLHAVQPQTAEEVSLEGQSQGPFSVTGSLRQANVEPSYRQVEATVPVSWAGGQVAGLSLGPGRMSARLAEARVSVDGERIPAQGGTLELSGMSVDLKPSGAVVATGANRSLLENVQVDKELGQRLLSRVNPIFGHVAAIDGRVTLTVDGVAVPLSKAILAQGQGRGRLALADVHIAPTGFLAELLQLAGARVSERQPVAISPADFRIDNGKILYDNFLLTFNQEVQLNFHGSVAFDDKLNLIASLPMGRPLLRRMGVSDAVAEYILLAKPRVDIPIVGTRQVPQIRLQDVDVSGLVDRATGRLLRERAGGLLEDLLDLKKKKPGGQSPPPPVDKSSGPEQESEGKGASTVGGLIFDILGSRREQEKEPVRPQK